MNMRNRSRRKTGLALSRQPSPINVRLLRRAGNLSAVRYGSILISSFTSVIIARSLTVEDRGRLSVAVTVGATTALCLAAGLDTLSLRSATGPALKAALDSAISRAMLALVIIIAPLSLLFIFGEDRLVLSLNYQELALALGVVPLAILTQLLGNTCIAISKFAAWGLSNIISPCLYLAGSVFLTMTGQTSVGALLAGLLLAYIASSGILLVALRAEMRGVTPRQRQSSSYRRTRRQAAAPTILQLAFMRIQVPILQILASATAVGHLAIAISIVEILLVVPVAVAALLLPQYHTQHPTTALVLRQARNTFLATALMALLVICIAPYALPLIFGTSYAASVRPLQFMAPAVAVFSYARVLQSHLFAMNLFTPVSIASVVAILVTVLVQVLLSPANGAFAAGIAIALGYLSFATCITISHRWRFSDAA